MKRKPDNLAASKEKTGGTETLTYDQFLEKEREKTQLLKISEAIAVVQDFKALLRVIYALIQPVFPFENTGLFVQDPSAGKSWRLPTARSCEIPSPVNLPGPRYWVLFC